MDQKLYDSYVKILKNELVPALGCTEPIAIAYAAAKAREVLGEMPESIELCCSGNIIRPLSHSQTRMMWKALMGTMAI